MHSAWVYNVWFCLGVCMIIECPAALEQLKVEMRDIQEAFQQQEQILKVLREEKLALVKQAR